MGGFGVYVDGPLFSRDPSGMGKSTVRMAGGTRTRALTGRLDVMGTSGTTRLALARR